MSTTMGCKRVGPRKAMKRTWMKRYREFPRMDANGLKRSPMKRGRGGLRGRSGSERAKLIQEIDSLHSHYIRQQNGGRCVTCGAAPQAPSIKNQIPTFRQEMARIECGHLFTRAAFSTRWDVAEGGNCHPQCHACNQRHESEPLVFEAWYMDRFGVKAFEDLRARHNRVEQLSISQLEEIREAMKVLAGRHTGVGS